MTVLDEIVAHKRVEVDARKAARPLSGLVTAVEGSGPARDFRSALIDPGKPAPRVIAEIKRRSPSKGLLRADIDVPGVARTYERNGAAAISVLADERFFGGSLADLREARQAVSIPVLCKEFIVDPYQLYEARLAGADAVLLIAAVLNSGELRDYREVANSLGMAALVEVHNEDELRTALDSGADIVGVNNRDLRTFDVSVEVTRRLVPHIPSNVVRVSESGFKGPEDRVEMAALGIDALLVGEGLIASADIGEATSQMCGLHIPSAELEGSRL